MEGDITDNISRGDVISVVDEKKIEWPAVVHHPPEVELVKEGFVFVYYLLPLFNQQHDIVKKTRLLPFEQPGCEPVLKYGLQCQRLGMEAYEIACERVRFVRAAQGNYVPVKDEIVLVLWAGLPPWPAKYSGLKKEENSRSPSGLVTLYKMSFFYDSSEEWVEKQMIYEWNEACEKAGVVSKHRTHISHFRYCQASALSAARKVAVERRNDRGIENGK